jgi:hypothetical protein
MKWIMSIVMFCLAIAIAADAEEIGCVSTTWRCGLMTRSV